MTQRKPAAKDREVVTLADLAPRRRVIGGSQRTVFGADPVGHAQEDSMAGTKRAAKDLPAKTTKVKGGSLAGNDNMTFVRGAKPSKKDLPSKTTKVKGGRGGWDGNDNLTLVRVAEKATWS